MRILVYAGPAPRRAQILGYAAPIVAAVASELGLVSGGGAPNQALLDEAAASLARPGLAVSLHLLPGDAQQAILAAAAARDYDLVILGRLNPPLRRILPGVRARSRRIAERLEPSVLRVDGPARPIRRILVASGGDHHTYGDVDVAARLATPLGAAITLLHVVSQQPVIFEGLEEHAITARFLDGDTAEAHVLRMAAARLAELAIPNRAVIRSGPVIGAILEELRTGDHDLLVIGAHRTASPLDHLLLEDITGELLDLSPLPVLVAR